jgi:hypothetical protein
VERPPLTWLPTGSVSRPSGKVRPWLAPSLRLSRRSAERLTYVVVDEIVEGIVGLSMSPWPVADELGRLRFDIEQDPVHVAVGLETLCEFLRGRGFPFYPPKEAAADEEKRGLLIGTTFAMEIKKPRAVRWGKPLDRWVGQIHDITADARDLAKLALYGALTEIWSEKKADRLGLVEEGEAQG